MNFKKYKHQLSPEMTVFTAALYYGVVVDYNESNPDMRVFKETGLGAQVVDDHILAGMFLNPHQPIEELLPYIQVLYYSPDCILNEFIRDFAGEVGNKWINHEMMGYWKNKFIEMGFYDLYATYSAATIQARKGYHSAPRENDHSCLRPRIFVVDLAVEDLPMVTLEESLNSKDVYTAFQLTEQKGIVIGTAKTEELLASQGASPIKEETPFMCKVCNQVKARELNTGEEFISICRSCSI